MLVVTTGGPKRVYNMMVEVVEKLVDYEFKYGNMQGIVVPYNWLFTSVDLLKLAYPQQLGSFNARTEKVPWEGNLGGHVWVPLSIILSEYTNRKSNSGRERRRVKPGRPEVLREYILDFDKALKQTGRFSINDNPLISQRAALPIHWQAEVKDKAS